MKYPYFRGLEADRYSFYRVPKALIKVDLFEKMSGDAKLLYAVLLDRMNLSLKNGWQDENGNAYIICTIDEIMDSIRCARQKAVKLLDELEHEYQLIERRRQGLGKPNLLYVKDLYAGLSQSNYWKYENQTSGGLKSELPGVWKSNGSKTDINNTDSSETDLIYSAQSGENISGEMREDERYRFYFQDKLEIPILEKNFPHDREILMEILELLVETVTSRKKFLRICGEEKPKEVVKSRLMKLDSMHILNNFKVLGVKAYPLNGVERLQIMYEMFHQEEERKFEFSYDRILQSGMTTKDFIAPTSFLFKSGKEFQMGDTIGAVSYLNILAPELTDKVLAEFLDMDKNLVVSIHVQSVDQLKAIKLIKGKITDLDRMKIEEQKKAVRSGYDILNVLLKNKGFDTIARKNMDRKQTGRYDAYNLTYGNRPELFGAGSPTYSGGTTGSIGSGGSGGTGGSSGGGFRYDIPEEALSDEKFARMIAEAEKYLGMPYVWGGSSPSTSFDCSGFVCWVINNCGNGWNVGRTTANGLRGKCSYVSLANAQPGDLIFFEKTYNTVGASHVGIYVGNGMMIHCGDPISYTSINSTYWQNHFLGFGRIK